ncbi:hypothetical protein [Neobacillus cucumis]|uniref:hypothetical protein n=1 Tax=Neobacillus cucumis TaxID=1740721 RepID=UPI001963BCBF|nr:hypothetical protein [Neobacillus cucumis]MBM7656380.1 hypothetical protein [Neobacillus cucumis]
MVTKAAGFGCFGIFVELASKRVESGAQDVLFLQGISCYGKKGRMKKDETDLT